jgi:hypothetical protein
MRGKSCPIVTIPSQSKTHIRLSPDRPWSNRQRPGKLAVNVTGSKQRLHAVTVDFFCKLNGFCALSGARCDILATGFEDNAR